MKPFTFIHSVKSKLWGLGNMKHGGSQSVKGPNAYDRSLSSALSHYHARKEFPLIDYKPPLCITVVVSLRGGKGTRNRVHSVAGGTPLGNMDSAPLARRPTRRFLSGSWGKQRSGQPIQAASRLKAVEVFDNRNLQKTIGQQCNLTSQHPNPNGSTHLLALRMGPGKPFIFRTLKQD